MTTRFLPPRVSVAADGSEAVAVAPDEALESDPDAPHAVSSAEDGPRQRSAAAARTSAPRRGIDLPEGEARPRGAEAARRGVGARRAEAIVRGAVCFPARREARVQPGGAETSVRGTAARGDRRDARDGSRSLEERPACRVARVAASTAAPRGAADGANLCRCYPKVEAKIGPGSALIG